MSIVLNCRISTLYMWNWIKQGKQSGSRFGDDILCWMKRDSIVDGGNWKRGGSRWVSLNFVSIGTQPKFTCNSLWSSGSSWKATSTNVIHQSEHQLFLHPMSARCRSFLGEVTVETVSFALIFGHWMVKALNSLYALLGAWANRSRIQSYTSSG